MLTGQIAEVRIHQPYIRASGRTELVDESLDGPAHVRAKDDRAVGVGVDPERGQPIEDAQYLCACGSLAVEGGLTTTDGAEIGLHGLAAGTGRPAGGAGDRSERSLVHRVN